MLRDGNTVTVSEPVILHADNSVRDIDNMAEPLSSGYTEYYELTYNPLI